MNATPVSVISAISDLAARMGAGPTIVVVLLLSASVLPVAAATLVLTWCAFTGRQPGKAGVLLVELVRLTRRDRARRAPPS